MRLCPSLTSSQYLVDSGMRCQLQQHEGMVVLHYNEQPYSMCSRGPQIQLEYIAIAPNSPIALQQSSRVGIIILIFIFRVYKYYHMQSPNLIFSLGNNTSLEIDEVSARIRELRLQGNMIISSEEPLNATSSGCYLMYPWVNRLEEPHPTIKEEFKDGNGLVIHGIMVNAKKNIKEIEKTQSRIIIQITCDTPIHQNIIQQYILEKNQLTINFKALNPKTQQIFCFGYHPFIQFNQTPISEMLIETNITKNLKLQQNMLPVYPFQEKLLKLDSSQKYDHLFRYDKADQAFINLKVKDGEGYRIVSVESEDMKYWQVYTPPDCKRIAIEPMTFCGDLYTISKRQKIDKLQDHGSLIIKLH